jgi:hypoxanthine phosphoribosyltransferase
VQFDYLHATRYRGETTGGDLVWKHKPATSLFGRRVLLVDDILDEGYTLQGVRTWCRAGRDRRAHRRDDGEEGSAPAGITADTPASKCRTAVFGFGMDVNEPCAACRPSTQ